MSSSDSLVPDAAEDFLGTEEFIGEKATATAMGNVTANATGEGAPASGTYFEYCIKKGPIFPL